MKTYRTAIFCSSSFKWKNNQGTCNKSDLITVDNRYMVGEYDGVLIESSKTGKLLYFKPVHDEDGYDGEFMIYRCDQLFIQIWNY